MGNGKSLSQRAHTFIVRIWWEAGLTQLDGRPLWRGHAQHVANGQPCAFQSLDSLLRFIQSQTGDLENDQPRPTPGDNTH